ncbi:MAG: hypothetical protein KDA90_17955 [Planctomycetaceae bacterium]|nr:hypothetical protein [Planctomycetaceae bacterium]
MRHPMILACLMMSMLLSIVTGCGGSPAHGVTVTGTILLDQLPVEFGTVTFIPEPGVSGPSGGTKIEAGIFTILPQQNLLPGKYRVEVMVIPRRPGGMDTPVTSASLSAPGDDWSRSNPVRSFRDPTLVVELFKGENSCDLDLSSPM